MRNHIVLECQNISHWFGENRVLHGINLKIIRGEIVALVGQTGAGKSTLLRAILGTHPPREGKVIVTGAVGNAYVVTKPGRDRGIVYQHYSLYPFLTAQQNVALGLMFDETSIPSRMFGYLGWRNLRRQHMEQAAALLEKVHLGDALHLYPHQMSGGMRQRAAVAQALIMKPEILLLDEPFGALDEATREELQRMLLELYADNCEAKRRQDLPPYTILIVTHELNEAIYVGDRVVALSRYWDWQGRHEKCPGATVVYDRMAPVNLPDEEKNFETFAKQRAEIRRAAFDPRNLQKREEFMNFWNRVYAGSGGGVLEDVWNCDDEACPLREICAMAREIRRIAKTRPSGDESQQVSAALRRTFEERRASFTGVTSLLWGDPRQAERVRQFAAKDCFSYSAQAMLVYLDKHAPEVRAELSEQLAPLSDLMKAGTGRSGVA